MASAKNLLVIEDEGIIALDLQNCLQRLGYTVPAVADSGEEAVKLATEIQPDLILVDIRLSGKIDGIEAVERIRAHFDIPVVYLTALLDDDTLQRAKATNPAAFLSKPYEEELLQTTIEAALRGR